MWRPDSIVNKSLDGEKDPLRIFGPLKVRARSRNPRRIDLRAPPGVAFEHEPHAQARTDVGPRPE